MKLKSIILPLAAVAAMAATQACGNKSTGADATNGTATAAATETATAPAKGVIELAKGETLPAPEQGKGMVIDFNATWCGPCRQFAPIFHKVAESNSATAAFYSVDVDLHPELAGRYNVTSIPTVVFIAPDGSVNTSVGFLEEQQFAELLRRYMNK